jgi:hypothetical protein
VITRTDKRTTHLLIFKLDFKSLLLPLLELKTTMAVRINYKYCIFFGSIFIDTGGLKQDKKWVRLFFGTTVIPLQTGRLNIKLFNRFIRDISAILEINSTSNRACIGGIRSFRLKKGFVLWTLWTVYSA